MKKSLTLFFIFYVGIANAQFTNPVYSDWTTGYAIGVHGRYQIATNAISSNFHWNAYQGKQLSRNLREQASNGLNANNSIGADIDFGLFAKHIPDSAKGLGWFINIADRSHANAKYPKDLFDLTMFGNAMFAGETANLNNININLLTYKQYEVGLLKQIDKDNGQWNLGVALSLLTGNRALAIDIPNANLYTQAEGEYLEGEIHGTVSMASLKSTQYFDANGVGFSAALHVAYQAEKFGISFEADDLGLVSWSKKLRTIALDSLFVFEGMEVNLFSADGNPFSSINLDTIVNGFATESVRKKFSSTVPGRLRIQGYYNLNTSDWKLYAGLQYRIASSYLPYGYIGTSSPLPSGFYIDGRFAYGGFGSWHVGLEVKKRFKEVFEIRLGTNNLEGYVLPMVGTSQSAYIGLTAFFK